VKRLFLLALLTLIAGYWVADKMAEDAGYVLLSYQNTTIETSLWIALALLLVLVATVFVGVWLLIQLLGSRHSLRRWGDKLRYKRSVSKTTRGLMDLIEGNWKDAQKKLSQAASQSDTPLMNYLSAARAAAANGDTKGCESLLKKAYQSTPSAELAIGITKAEIGLQQANYQQTRALLLALRQAYPRHKQVANLLQQTYVGLEDWQGLQELMPVLRKLKVLASASLNDLEHKAALNRLKALATQLAGQGLPSCVGQFDKAWDHVPSNIRQAQDITRFYVAQMMSFGAPQKAEVALRNALDAVWNDVMVVEYGLLEGCADQQLHTAQGWLKKHDNSAALLLTLGRLSLRNQLWGKARGYFSDSLAQHQTPEAHAELGRLLKHMGEHEASLKHVQKSFDVVSASLPVMPMPDEQRTSMTQRPAPSDA
jgi:HemY protein